MQCDHALYYRTDTHWNNLGAAHAFHAFAEHVRRADPTFQWPTENPIRLQDVKSRDGGDLARFLRMQNDLPDVEPTIHAATEDPIETSEFDFDSGRLVRAGGNPKIGTPTSAVRIVSGRALNRRKVLWLRDSFGTALSPLMAVTFTEILQLPWHDALVNRGRRLIDLVESWRPDYVFVTVVERNSRSELFTTLPPVQ
jgi:hypothetical protein